ncbi:YjgN family protein [Amylibacter sp.]|nr:YjgN family protein [Amylibacter sp.]
MSSDVSNDPFSRLHREETRVATAASPPMDVEYRGAQSPLFWLALRTALLTLVTLGFYRFWAKTRIRKYFWSATAPGGDPMEYTGNGLEKLLGFLIAVAFLAIYLGLFQVVLSFVGLSVFSGGDGPQSQVLQVALGQATLLAVIPFIFYAQYRARRYILSRTRWRGVRFGVDAAAWGYVWRALVHSFITIISLGLLLPRQTFWLEKYKIDRTWYGNTKFVQGGKWTSLYPAMKHYFIAGALIAVPSLLAAVTEQPVWLFFAFIGGVWFYYAFAFYAVESFRILADQKRLGERVGFITAPRASKVFWTYVLGALLASTCAGLVFSAFSVVAGNFIGVSALGLLGEGAQLFNPENMSIGFYIGISLFVVGYLAMLLSYGVFGMIFVSQPVLEHYVETTQILNPEALDDIQQRSRDEMVEAEGFADALDVGAAI